MASMPHARLDLHDPCRDLTHRGAVWRCEVDESADESVWKMRSKLDWCYLMLDSPKIFSNLWSSFFTVSTKNTQMGFWIMSRWWQNSVGLVGLDVQNANMDLFKQRWKWLSINKAHLESPFLILQCFFMPLEICWVASGLIPYQIYQDLNGLYPCLRVQIFRRHGDAAII